MKKRVIWLLLIICLILTVIPIEALAGSTLYATSSMTNLIINSQTVFEYSPVIGQEQNIVKVGIIDSGISSSVGINFIEGYNYLLDSVNTEDDTGHGTALASIISSICPDAEIVPLKITDKLFITTSEVTSKAIYDAVDIYKCDILLLAFGQSDTKSLHEAIKYADKNGVIIISAVGNEGHIKYRKNKKYYPAGYEEVIGVGSTDDYGLVSYFSQKNESVFIATKGENLKAISLDGTDKYVNGTSFSAASIAGLAAKLKVKKANEFREYLKLNAIDKGEIGFDTSYGWGFINIEKLLEEDLNEN